MAQKVATARKMKSRRDNLRQPNCDIDGKANNKQQAFVNTDMRCFKIQTGDMGPPLAGPQCSINIIAVCEAFYIYIFCIPWLPENLSVSILKGICKWPCLIMQHNSPPCWLSMATYFCFPYQISVLQNSISWILHPKIFVTSVKFFKYYISWISHP